METQQVRSLLQTAEEKQIASLRREVEHWKREAQEWKDTSARLDLYIEQKNAFILKLEKTIKYLRNKL